ncbi:MAG: hypothetical protein ACK5AY_13370 [Bacteroidota bacterium]
MKKMFLIAFLTVTSLITNAQVSKSEVESIVKSVNLQELKDIYLIRTRQHDGAVEGWFERFEKLDPKTAKISINDHSLLIEGSSYAAFLPFDKIKLIFHKKQSHLIFELQD